ncbi:FecR domain-containing protein [Larkinella bovis]|uniref:FecR domain-containing protein n=1 Tax=Larkinella bovis TaxID=683041 RepID=A0ABW0IEL8_9BACT
MDGQLLKKYFSGACTPAEELEVLTWFKNKNLDPEQEQDLYRMWQETGEDPLNVDPGRNRVEIFDRIIHAIESQEAEPVEPVSEPEMPLPGVERRRWLWWLGAAAAMVVVITKFLVPNPFQKAEPIRILQAVAPYGQRKVVQLDDGSVIHLHSGSRLTYPAHFQADKREVGLIGEAFFDVKRDTLRPFTVRSGHLLTQVLGTTFNIKYRLNAETMAVSLATGSVQVRQIGGKRIGQTARLVPGEQLVYAEKNVNFEVRPFDRDEVLGWQKGLLNFRKSSLSEVVEKLENWYGVRVELRGKVPRNPNDWKYSGSYDNQSLENVLTGIAFVKNFAYETRGNVVIMNFN